MTSIKYLQLYRNLSSCFFSGTHSDYTDFWEMQTLLESLCLKIYSLTYHLPRDNQLIYVSRDSLYKLSTQSDVVSFKRLYLYLERLRRANIIGHWSCIGFFESPRIEGGVAGEIMNKQSSLVFASSHQIRIDAPDFYFNDLNLAPEIQVILDYQVAIELSPKQITFLSQYFDNNQKFISFSQKQTPMMRFDQKLGMLVYGCLFYVFRQVNDSGTKSKSFSYLVLQELIAKQNDNSKPRLSMSELRIIRNGVREFSAITKKNGRRILSIDDEILKELNHFNHELLRALSLTKSMLKVTSKYVELNAEYYYIQSV